MSDTWVIVTGLVAVVLLILLNALFVAAEFSLVGVRRTRVEQLAAGGQSRARMLLGSLHHLDRSIAATQLGITMAGLALGWLGEPVLARVIEPPVAAALSFLPAAVGQVASVVLAFAVVTALVIVFAELAPKSIALSNAEGVALWLALPLNLFGKIFTPVVWLLNRAGRAVVRPFGIRPAGAGDETLDTDELELVIEASARAGLLSTSELLLARRALEFSAIQADQIMVPRTEVVAVDAEDTLEEVLAKVKTHQHTRYPVFEEDLDHILGVLDAKDLLGLVAQHESNDWRPLVRPAVAIPESVSVEVAVAAMRAKQVQLVVLVDEHGGTSGILTADEVLYRLLGRWLGSRGKNTENVRTLPAGNLLVSGLALIADLEDATNAELADEDYDTVGGFIMSRLGRIPHIGDRVEVPGYQFRVMAMDGRRVDRVLVVKLQDPPSAGEAAQ